MFFASSSEGRFAINEDKLGLLGEHDQDGKYAQTESFVVSLSGDLESK